MGNGRLRVLIAGESWSTHSIHIKGFDSFTTNTYEEGVGPLREALETAGHAVTFQPNHVAMRQFPHTLQQIWQFDVVILSDIGANTLLLRPEVFTKSMQFPNRLELIHEYVKSGGGLIMVGGYLSFQGINGQAAYRGTPVEAVLPVEIGDRDDRVEAPQGVHPHVLIDNHPAIQGAGTDWPALLGYNRVTARPGAEVLVECKGDPLIALMSVGTGRSAVFTSDCGPHWAPPAFLSWPGYQKIWQGLIRWTGNRVLARFGS
jgi:uncharacterized membrane protein